MARTFNQIYDEIIAEKEGSDELLALQPATDSAQTLLQDLTSTSKVSIWRLIYAVWAFSIRVFEGLQDIHFSEVEALKETLVTGTDKWYAQKAKEFQLGDSLVWTGVRYAYEVDDTEKQIIAFSAAITENSILRIKVAKDDGNGVPEKLSGSELTSFTGYVDDIIFAGTQRSVISQDADLMKFYANILYNPLLLASDGSLLTDPSTFPVEDAINNYIYNLDFNGTFRIIDLIDAVQNVSGIINVVITTLEIKPEQGVYTDILNSAYQKYVARAGYINIDTAFPLSTTLTYIVD